MRGALDARVSAIHATFCCCLSMICKYMSESKYLTSRWADVEEGLSGNELRGNKTNNPQWPQVRCAAALSNFVKISSGLRACFSALECPLKLINATET